MGKLDFCPYDGKKIDPNNLAYEVICADGWDWNRVRNETVISNKIRSYILENDVSRQKNLEFVDREQHVILLASQRGNGKNGLELLKELVQNGENEEQKEVEEISKHSSDSFEDKMKRIYSMRFELNETDTKADTKADSEGLKTCEISGTGLQFSSENGLCTFLNEAADPVFYALPCCPYCHNRLPAGWNEADDFIGISLLGSHGAGKTSFLYSLFNNKAESLAQTVLLKNESLSIRPAHFEKDKKDTIYAYVSEQSEKMCTENGKCPVNEKCGENVPVFLRADYGKGADRKTLIVGIYDEPVSFIDRLDTVTSVSGNQLLNHLYADMYLFDPRDMGIENISLKRMKGYSQFKKCSAMSLAEQAEYQKENRDMVVNAKKILESGYDRDTEEKAGNYIPTLKIYEHVVSMYRRYADPEYLSNKRFLGVVSKSDLLRGKLSSDYDELLYSREKTSAVDAEDIAGRSKAAEKMLESYGMLGRSSLHMFEKDYGKGISWHSISSTGCDAVENDHLLGAYAPVNVGDPVISCIISRIKELNWA